MEHDQGIAHLGYGTPSWCDPHNLSSPRVKDAQLTQGRVICVRAAYLLSRAPRSCRGLDVTLRGGMGLSARVCDVHALSRIYLPTPVYPL